MGPSSRRSSMPFTIGGGRITFKGTARITGGTGAYRGVTSGTLQAADTNTLDGQDGHVTVTGFARYRDVARGTARAVPAAARAPRRNVVTIMTDDQDFRSMWAMPKTRRLIARRGTTFATSSVELPALLPGAGDVLHGPVRPQPRREVEQLPAGRLRQARSRTRRSPSGCGGPATGRSTSASTSTRPASATRTRSRWDGTDYWGGVDPSTYDYYGMTINHNGRLVTYPRAAALLLDRRLRGPRRAGDPAGAPRREAVLPQRRAERAAHRLRQVATPRSRAPRRSRRRATRTSSPTRALPRYPNFDEADISDKPAWLGFSSRR